jgi:hypothetical protein
MELNSKLRTPAALRERKEPFVPSVVHVDGERLCLWTAVSNGPIVHPSDDIWIRTATVELYWQGKTEDLENNLQIYLMGLRADMQLISRKSCHPSRSSEVPKLWVASWGALGPLGRGVQIFCVGTYLFWMKCGRKIIYIYILVGTLVDIGYEACFVKIYINLEKYVL